MDLLPPWRGGANIDLVEPKSSTKSVYGGDDGSRTSPPIAITCFLLQPLQILTIFSEDASC